MSSQDTQVARFSPYPLRQRSKGKKGKDAPFEVPEWAGTNQHNTCIVDSFLAMLMCAQHRDAAFVSLVRGESKFTIACREFLEDGGCEMDTRKLKFIRKLFKTDSDGEFNLEGDEANVILDKAKEASTINFSTHCTKCDKHVTTKKDYFYSGMDKTKDTMDEVLFNAMVRADRRHRCTWPEACKDAIKNVQLESLESTWMIPIDISQLGILPDRISEIPSRVEVTGVNFRLMGVSLFGDAHYTAVLHDQSEWYYYDGLLAPPIRSYSNLKSMAMEFDPSSRLKIAYYLRTND